MNSSQAWNLSGDNTEIPGNAPGNKQGVFCTIEPLKLTPTVAGKSDPYAPSRNVGSGHRAVFPYDPD